MFIWWKWEKILTCIQISISIEININLYIFIVLYIITVKSPELQSKWQHERFAKESFSHFALARYRIRIHLFLLHSNKNLPQVPQNESLSYTQHTCCQAIQRWNSRSLSSSSSPLSSRSTKTKREWGGAGAGMQPLPPRKLVLQLLQLTSRSTTLLVSWTIQTLL